MVIKNNKRLITIRYNNLIPKDISGV